MNDLALNSLRYLFVSMIISAILAPIMIHFLYVFHQVSIVKKSKLGIGGGTNALWRRLMNRDETNGTPNMGGILIWLVVPIISLIFVELTPSIKAILIGFLIFGFWGFLDTAFTNAIRDKEKLKTLQETFGWRMGKLAIAILLNIGVMYLIYNTGALKELSILNYATIAITPILIPILGLVGQFAIYSAEITDGLDGLMVGIFGIITASFIGLLVLQGQFTYIPLLAITLGVILVDLYFNIPPARFWNGGPGAMPLGFLIFVIGLLTDNLIPYFFMTAMTWIIMFSSMIQIISMKFFKKRVFKIAPIHHHFQAIGWPKDKVTMRFWLFTIISSIIGIYLGIL